MQSGRQFDAAAGCVFKHVKSTGERVFFISERCGWNAYNRRFLTGDIHSHDP
jgi:hypothetical protein